ncbi:hypothetical protein E2562_022582 [Oryza meyeriana var. granulata]|uniref:Uncharacterized protein n=1 Tax=Oryza meyeriana var. granulata TaxID=110450 RepID=A0A6G1CST9_9ORYZ|nr:hypothetical protein E2562_022582 [Oryza meyeriana var. granulata]
MAAGRVWRANDDMTPTATRSSSEAATEARSSRLLSPPVSSAQIAIPASFPAYLKAGGACHRRRLPTPCLAWFPGSRWRPRDAEAVRDSVASLHCNRK